MTRRLTIVLELDTRSSDRVRCGVCPHLSAIQGEPMLSNGSRAQQTACDLFGAESDVPGDRVAACFAAERAAARLVDAASSCLAVFHDYAPAEISDRPKSTQRAWRSGQALDSEARKAGR